MTRVQFPAAEFFELLQIWQVRKPFAFPVVCGGFGSGLLLDNRTIIRLLRPPRNPPFSLPHPFTFAHCHRHGTIMCMLYLEALGVGYFFELMLLKLDLFAHPAILHFRKGVLEALKGISRLGNLEWCRNQQIGRRTRLDTWPRGVTVSTLDSESSDRGSNPREAFRQCAQFLAVAIAAFGVESGPKNILAKLVFAIASSKASLRKGQ